MTSAHQARLPRPATAVVFCLGTALAVGLAPLAVYVLSLAAFGLPHVLSELRYVDARFRTRLRGWIGVLVLGLLAVLVVARVGSLGLFDRPWSTGTLQLMLLAGLVVVTLPVLLRAGPSRGALGLAVLAATVWGLRAEPVACLVVLSFLHNLTPVAFLAERLRGAERRRVLLGCGLVFGLVPAAIAMGGVERLVGSLARPELAPWDVGGVDAQLGVFVPDFLREEPLALRLFSAAVFLQCVHYAVVLHVLPGLLSPEEQRSTWLAWPQGRVLNAGIAACGALFFVGFALSFPDARSVYGVFASVHAWIEVPVLLLALAPIAVRAAPAS